jgi:hypothetical protein
MRVRSAVFFLALMTCGPVRAQDAQDDAGIRALLNRLEQIVQAGDTAGFLALLASSADAKRAVDFGGTELMPGVAHAVIQERDRLPLPGTLPGNGYRLMVDAFAEFGSRARIATWRLDIRRSGEASAWTVADEERLSSVDNIYRLSLNAAKQFTARNLSIAAEDLDLTLAEGSVFVAEIDQGVTALVLLGRGTMNFHPLPDTEKGQVRIFSGADTIDASFSAAYVRLSPGGFDALVASSHLQPRAVDPRELRRAQDVFREESQKSFTIDLGDLSRDAWSLLPGAGDFLAEVRTRRFDTLTYAKSSNEAEDITLFDRKRHHNIALYASQARLALRGRFYNEDDLVEYDVLHYDLDIAVTPDRQWIDGRATLHVKVRAVALGALTLRLANALTVQSVVTREYGRLFYIRVKNQNTLVVNLPTAVPRDAELTLTIAYAGRLEPQTPERETIAMDPQGRNAAQDDMPTIALEPSSLYSSRSFWYPQGAVSDYATAFIRITVPSTIECVASGELEPGFPAFLAGKEPSQNRKIYAFSASRPLRYLSFILSRLDRVETTTIAFPPETDGARMADVAGTDSGPAYRSLNLSVEANPRQGARGRELADRAADIATFYESLIGDSPYSSFTVAVLEADLPGGHSPGHFAALYQQLPTSQLVWRNDPAAFSNFPDFFIAHELAHQWWGQAVGWRNYHEQWISEGFAQYFAALYAQHQRGDEAFGAVLRQFRKWGMEASPQGPVSLGYRLGHIRGESRIFRALVYNKGAAVLHMLRRLVGDEAFFRGLRRFYRESRFHKAGTDDFRVAMERETGQPLERFFERWIYGSTLPKLKVSCRVEGTDVVVRVEQQSEEVFDVPLTVTLQYADRKPVEVRIAVTDRKVETRVPLAGVLRGFDVSKDDATLAEIVKG